MKRPEIVAGLFILFTAAFMVAYGVLSGAIDMPSADRPSVDGQQLNVTDTNLTVKMHTSGGKIYPFTVELATTPEECARGLMYRTSMARDAGMLFDFNSIDIRRFWMENTLIPLDMIFIDQDGKIIDIHENATPLSRDIIESSQPCRYVLEVNGGICKDYDIRTGDLVTIERI